MFVVDCHPQRRRPRLRRSWRAQCDGRSGERLHEGARQGAPGRLGQGHRRRGRRPAGRRGERARRARRSEMPASSRSVARVRFGLAIGLRGACGYCCRPCPCPRTRLGGRRHRCGRQHRVGDRRRPRAGRRRWHVPPPRPHPRARPRRPRPGEVHDRSRRAEARPGRPHRGAGSAGNTGADRAGAGCDRASASCAGGHRRDHCCRRHASTGTPATCATAKAMASAVAAIRTRQRARRCAAARRRPGDQPLPAGEVDGRVRPRLRREGRRLVPPAPRLR